jgi:TPR repeat protein
MTAKTPPIDLVQAAEAGDAKAQNDLGLWYFEHLPQTPYSRTWFERAAAQGQSNAMHNLGILAARADDHDLAIAWYNRAAAAGSILSYYYMGRVFRRTGDDTRAFQAFDKGARGGSLEAQDALCELILEKKLEEHYDLAFFLTNRNAEQGRANAQRILGHLYAQGIGVEPDPQKAISWWQESARNGDMVAQYNLGTSYHRGHMVGKDRVAAMRFLMAAAAQGDDEAQAYLPRVEAELTHQERQTLRDKDQLTRADVKPATASPPADLVKAAQAGNADAQSDLGRWFGENFPGTSEAFDWFKRAAAQGLPKAMHNLGVIAFQANDRALAMKWFRKAVAGGWRNSIVPLGMLLKENGNIDEAFVTFQRGIQLGCPDSEDALSQLIVDSEIKASYELALSQTTRAAEQGRAIAQVRLAKIYNEALGVERDPGKAMSLYLQAAEQGHSGAQLAAGVALHMGFCLKQDRVAAMRFLMASADQGNDGAEIYLRDVEKDLTAEKRQTLARDRAATRH